MPNKPLLRFLVIAAVLLAVAGIVASQTYFNKWWWAQRINKKYNLQEPLTRDGAFVQSQSLRSLMELYRNGEWIGGGAAVA